MRLNLLAFGRNILLIALLMLLTSLATNLISPVWPIYIRGLGASMTELGFIFSLSNAAGALLQVPSGLLSDRYGRRKLHALGTLMAIFPPVLYAFARSSAELIPWVLLSGAAVGLYFPLRFSIVADETGVEQRAKAYSWVNVAFLIGPTIGPSIGGLIADAYGIRASFFATATLLAVSFTLTISIGETRNPSSVPHSRRRGATLSPWFVSVPLLAVFAVNAVQGVAIGLFSPVTPIFVTTLFPVDLTFVGVLFAVGFGLSSLLGQLPGGRLAGRWNRRSLIVASIMASAPFFALFSSSRTILELFVYMSLANGILALSWPALQALTMDMTPSGSWGFVNGVTASGFWGGMTVGSMLSGIIWDTMGMNAPYYASGLAILGSALPALLLTNRPGGRDLASSRNQLSSD